MTNIDPRKYVTPYLGKEVLTAIGKYRGHAFVKAFPPQDEATVSCRNCLDLGYIYVVFCKDGPFKTPAAFGVSTWYEGGPRAGKGWYKIDQTIAFSCPMCQIAEDGGIRALEKLDEISGGRRA